MSTRHRTVRDSSSPRILQALCSWWTIRLAGAIALVWFLVRVIPKPSRATYSCQRAAFPLTSGFVIWLISVAGAVTAWRKAKVFQSQSRWRLAGMSMLLAGFGAWIAVIYLPQPDGLAQTGAAGTFAPSEPVNSPMGTAYGVQPGRVAWSFDPAATTWNGTTNSPGWWDDSNTHPDIVAAMLSSVVRSVGDAGTDKLAWENIFTDHNRRSGKPAGYSKGQKIAIKLNLNQCRSHGDNANASYIAPQLVEALLKQLVNEAGVAPSDIACFDVIRQVPSTIFDRCTKAFPGVRFVDSVGGDGREKAVVDPTHRLSLAEGGAVFYFPTVVTEATYLINVAGLKGHTLAGITVCAKNHLGSFLTDRGAAGAPQVHRYITVRSGRGGGGQEMGSYNALVDLNGHEQLGGKTVLYLIDALYASQTNETRLSPACKWQCAPFNGNWTASLFASQDMVAIDSVALDFLRNEPSLSVVTGWSVDNYLHEMALAQTAPSKTVYDPEKDQKPLGSMGVHEHWNSAEKKQYSRNLGAKSGIELVQLRPTAVAGR